MLTQEQKRDVAIRVVAKAWSSDDYKKKLIETPIETFAGEGLEVTEPFKVSEEVKGENVFFLPPPPENAGEMKLVDLQGAAATQISNDREMF